MISWKISLDNGDKDKFYYEYKVHNPDGSIVTRTAVMKSDLVLTNISFYPNNY